MDGTAMRGVRARLGGSMAIVLVTALLGGLAAWSAAPAMANETTTGSVHVFKVGDRADDGSLVGLAGATIQLYSDAQLANPVAGKSCITDGNGECDITNISWTGFSDDYWVAESGSPSGFQAIPEVTTTDDGTAPYARKVTISNADPTAETTLYNRRDNPAFPTGCGVDIALIIDHSTSIDAGELNQMKVAGNAFAQALVNTPSAMSVYKFADGADELLSMTSLDTGNPGGLTAVQNAINSVPGNGGLTNWDAAFREVAADGNARVAIMLTDGDPTRTADSSTGSDTDLIDIEEGVASANLLKSKNSPPGTTVLAVGIGSAPSVANLAAISGPTLNVDYFVSDFDALLETLNDIATASCGAHVNITKNLDGVPTANWTFTATSSTSGVTFNPNPGVTDAGGIADFSVNGIPEEGAQATFTETQLQNSSFVSATCDNQSVGADGSVSLVVHRGDTINCTFNNSSFPNLSINKSGPATAIAGTTISYDVTVTNHGPGDSGPITVTDTIPAGLDLVSAGGNGWTCVGDPAMTCTHASIAQGESSVINVVADIGADVTDDVVNCATVDDTVVGDEDDTSCALTIVDRSVNLVVVKSDSGAQPVAGGANGTGSFTYTVSVANAGPSDAAADATVTDVLPAGLTFESFGALPAGVVCGAPVGQVFTCTIPAALLVVGADPVEIPVNVSVPASTGATTLVNKVIVGSTDDPAPCLVSETDITCTPSDTDNYAQVSTVVVAVGGETAGTGSASAPAAAGALAVTGSDLGRGLLGVMLLLAGGCVVLVARRRRHGLES